MYKPTLSKIFIQKKKRLQPRYRWTLLTIVLSIYCFVLGFSFSFSLLIRNYCFHPRLFYFLNWHWGSWSLFGFVLNSRRFGHLGTVSGTGFLTALFLFCFFTGFGLVWKLVFGWVIQIFVGRYKFVGGFEWWGKI